MKNLSALSKYIALISIISISIWVGSYLTRLFLIYQLFEGPDLILRPYINDENITGILTTILPVIVVHFISYIIFVITSLLFVITSKVNFRNNGWLFIMAVITLILTPFEAYLMTIDYKVITSLTSNIFDSKLILSLLIERIKVLGSFPIVAMLSYISFFYFIIFQPLTKKS